jgi:hypothetical protein
MLHEFIAITLIIAFDTPCSPFLKVPTYNESLPPRCYRERARHALARRGAFALDWLDGSLWPVRKAIFPCSRCRTANYRTGKQLVCVVAVCDADASSSPFAGGESESNRAACPRALGLTRAAMPAELSGREAGWRVPSAARGATGRAAQPGTKQRTSKGQTGHRRGGGQRRAGEHTQPAAKRRSAVNLKGVNGRDGSAPGAGPAAPPWLVPPRPRTKLSRR